jgi:hypothetical protein
MPTFPSPADVLENLDAPAPWTRVLALEFLDPVTDANVRLRKLMHAIGDEDGDGAPPELWTRPVACQAQEE